MDMPHVGGSGSSVAAQVGGAQGGVRRKRRPSGLDFAKPLNETNAKNLLRKGRAFNLVRPKAEGRTKRSPHFVMDIPRTSHGFVGLPGVHHSRRWFMPDSGHTNMGDIQRSQHDKRETEAQRPAQTAKRGSIAFHQVEIGIGGTLGKSRFRAIRARRTTTSPPVASPGLAAVLASCKVSATALIAACGTGLAAAARAVQAAISVPIWWA